MPRLSLIERINRVAGVEIQLLQLVHGNKTAPIHPDAIEIMSYMSKNPWFRSVDFRLELIRYRTETYPKMLSKAKARMRAETRRKNASKKKRGRIREPRQDNSKC